MVNMPELHRGSTGDNNTELLLLILANQSIIAQQIFFIIQNQIKMADQNAQILDLANQIKAGVADIIVGEQAEDQKLEDVSTAVAKILADEQSGADQSTTVAALQDVLGSLTNIKTESSNQTAKLQAVLDSTSATTTPPPPPPPATTDVNYTLADGTTIITIKQASPDAPATGDAVVDSTGAALADGSYTLNNGASLTVDAGVLFSFAGTGQPNQ